ncbi:ABC transporter permease [uncultured Cloacibacillus sp.]|uniref:ABC transporter permease n=1 Tax=uncultured Cloacibacillus sp. TaxID=889794 RepID=UPI0026DC2F66|nr:ABC transporter permease subunit [uncultured Cloacibacillus sp.]
MKYIVSFAKDYIGTVVIVLSVYFAYMFATDTQILDRYLFPQIGNIGEAFKKYWPEMLQNLKASFELLIPGVICGVSFALLIGVPMGLSRRFRKTLHPIIYSFSMIPVVLLSPFAIHIAPTLRAASVFLVIWGTVWAMLFATINGIMTIDKRYLDTATVLGVTGFKRLYKIILPAAFPSMAGGFVTAMRSAFLSLIFAEMYGTKFGMGYFVKSNSDLGYFAKVWSGFLFMALVMVVLMQIIEKTKDYILRWTID